MNIEEKIIKSCYKIYILSDEKGNVATGQSYREALGYLILRRRQIKKERGSNYGMV